jgi:hypothetical protein
VDERPWDPPRYEHKSGMIIPRYANTGADCGSATHGTIRRHHSLGTFDSNIIKLKIPDF